MQKAVKVQKFLWGKTFLPLDAGTEHFLVVGATGSGKTTLISRLLKSVLQSPGADSRRALIYDPKQDTVSHLYHPDLNLRGRVRILHPFDTRCCAWDMAQDIDGPLNARQVATILVPQEKGSENSSFFTHAVRDLLTGVFLSFINCVPHAKSWTFRDILLTMLYEPYLRYILSLRPPVGTNPLPMLDRVRETYLTPETPDVGGADPRTAANIRATINSTLGVYEPVAAAWFQAWIQGGKGKPLHVSQRYRLSLTEWIKSNEILVMGNDEASRSALDPINRAIFCRLTELTLASTEFSHAHKAAGENQTWFFLDEVREAGELEGLSRLMTKGRSKGACVVLGFQDIDGLRSVYGEEIANEITGQCSNIAILRLNSPSTAEWAVQLYGEALEVVTSHNISSGTGGSNSGSADELTPRAAVYSRSLLTLPLAHKDYGLEGYFKLADDSDGIVKPEHLDWSKNIGPYLLEENDDDDDFTPRPPSEHYLLPWDQADWDRLGFSGNPIPWSTPPAKTTQKQSGKASSPRNVRPSSLGIDPTDFNNIMGT